jgi:hypothetical protein
MCTEPISTMTLLVHPEAELPTGSVGPKFENGAGGCYKATVNESETITEAQPLCLADRRHNASGRRAFGFWYPVARQIERS